MLELEVHPPDLILLVSTSDRFATNEGEALFHCSLGNDGKQQDNKDGKGHGKYSPKRLQDGLAMFLPPVSPALELLQTLL